MIPKFKAFCKRHKCIEEVFQITYLGDNDIKVEAECLSGYVGSDFILMQSTGLHDSTKFEDLLEEEQEEWLESGNTAEEWKGREIFEGDIVEIIYDGETFTGVVVYDLGETDFKATNNREDYGNNFQYLTVGESIEVIGNVHQHPELLEVSDD
ncbi:hypothetical protein GYN24_04235 [Lactococcus piscium]|uniref:YopX family protein n=1 Tax=Pseudolactococcus paracarnosus TaxID=2749962 RepID=UPI001FBA9D34|nr:YopX family protein [Lactococcus paracarnosus]MCJ1993786.1 hypothetical protein [Lactococcus paracarnosus]